MDRGRCLPRLRKRPSLIPGSVAEERLRTAAVRRPSIAEMLVAPVPAPGWHSTYVWDLIKAVGDLKRCSSHSLALERKGGKNAERESETLFSSS